MSLAVLFATAFVIGLSGAVMPGPLLTVTITESLRRDWRAALWLVAGHGVLELGVVVLLAFGLSPLVNHPLAVRGTALAGGAVLAWMAVGAFRTARHPHPLDPQTLDAGHADVRTTGARAAAGLAGRGAAVSVANPYWLVWWATIGVTYVLQAREYGPAGLPAFYAGHLCSDAAWYLLVGVACSTGRQWLHDRALRRVFLACGLVLAGFGVVFVLVGLGVLPHGRPPAEHAVPSQSP